MSIDMRGYHSHDMVIPDFIVQGAGSSDGGWHDSEIDFDSDVDSKRKSVLMRLGNPHCIVYVTEEQSRPSCQDRPTTSTCAFNFAAYHLFVAMS